MSLLLNHNTQFCDMEKILGDYIRQKVREDGRTAQVISDELGMTRGNLDKIYHKDSLNTDQLAQFCGVLNYDFFRHINPFRADEVDKVRQLHPYQHAKHLETGEAQEVYETPGNQIEKCLRDLQAAHRELNFLQQNLQDIKSNVEDKDEIVALQKDKIRYLTDQLAACKEKE